MTYLSDFLYVTMLVHTQGLDRHSFPIVDAFPNISESPRGDRVFTRLDEICGYSVGGGE